MRPMTSDELKQLNPGDYVYTNREVLVTKTGRKWIHLANREKIDIERACTSYPSHSQWERQVYKDKEAYKAYADYCKEIDEARKAITRFVSRGTRNNVLKVAEFIRTLK